MALAERMKHTVADCPCRFDWARRSECFRLSATRSLVHKTWLDIETEVA